MTRVLNLHVQPVQRLPHVAWRVCSLLPPPRTESGCPRSIRGRRLALPQIGLTYARTNNLRFWSIYLCMWCYVLRAAARRGQSPLCGGAEATCRLTKVRANQRCVPVSSCAALINRDWGGSGLLRNSTVVATRATGRPLHEGEVRKVCMGHMEPVLGGRGGARWAACFGALKFIIIHNQSQHCAWIPEREEGKTMQARGAGRGGAKGCRCSNAAQTWWVRLLNRCQQQNECIAERWHL
jgi:hypothetical protein